MLVKSLKLHPYGGKYHAKGSEYEMSKKSDIKLMVAIKCVEPVEVKKTVPDKDVESEVKTPFLFIRGQSVSAEPRVETRGRKKGYSYDRKDMQAKTNY
jgi:hypothetical protein